MYESEGTCKSTGVPCTYFVNLYIVGYAWTRLEHCCTGSDRPADTMSSDFVLFSPLYYSGSDSKLLLWLRDFVCFIGRLGHHLGRKYNMWSGYVFVCLLTIFTVHLWSCFRTSFLLRSLRLNDDLELWFVCAVLYIIVNVRVCDRNIYEK